MAPKRTPALQTDCNRQMLQRTAIAGARSSGQFTTNQGALGISFRAGTGRVLWTNYIPALECRQFATIEPGESVTAILGWIIIGFIFGLLSLALLWPGYRLVRRAHPNALWLLRGYFTATAVCSVILWRLIPLVVHGLFGRVAP